MSNYISALDRSVFYSSLLVRSIDENVRELNASPELMALFRQSVSLEPDDAAVKEVVARLAITLEAESTLPAWIKPLQIEYAPSEIIELVQNNRIDQINALPPKSEAFWLAVRDRDDNSLLHIALSQRNQEMAKCLLDKAPALLLATNRAGKLPLDMCKPEDFSDETVEMLVSYYPPKGERHAAFQSLAYLCYLENELWALRYVKKQEMLLGINPSEVAGLKANYHPFKLCPELGKSSLGVKLAMPLDWLCAADAREMVKHIVKSKVAVDMGNIELGQYGATSPLVPEDTVINGKIAILRYMIHSEMEPEILDTFLAQQGCKSSTDKAKMCLQASLDAPATKARWNQLSGRERVALLTDLLASFYASQFSESGRTFFSASIAEALDSHIEIPLDAIRTFLTLDDLELAKKIILQAKASVQELLQIVVEASASLLEIKELSHLRYGLSSELLLSLATAVKAEALLTLVRTFPDESLKVAKPTLLAALARLHLATHKPLVLDLVRQFLPAQKDLSELLDEKISLQSYLMLVGGRDFCALLPQENPWQPKEVMRVAKWLEKEHRRLSLFGLTAFLRASLPMRPQLGSEQFLKSLISYAVDLIESEQDLTLLTLVDEFLQPNQEKVKEFKLESFLHFIRGDSASAIPIVEWLLRLGIKKFATFRLIDGNAGFKKWFFTNVMKGYSFQNESRKARESEIKEYQEVFQECAEETMLALRRNSRFEKVPKHDAKLVHKEVSFYITQNKAKKLQPIKVLKNGKLVMEGYYTAEFLLSYIEEECQKLDLEEQRRHLSAMPQLEDFGARALPPERPMDGLFAQPNALTVYIKNFPQVQLIEAYYSDLETGETKRKAFPYSQHDVVQSVRQFIEDHELKLKKRREALSFENVQITVSCAGRQTQFQLPLPPELLVPHDSFIDVAPGVPSFEKAQQIVEKLIKRKTARSALLEKARLSRYTIYPITPPTCAGLFSKLPANFERMRSDLLVYDFWQERVLMIAKDPITNRFLFTSGQVMEVEKHAQALRLAASEMSGFDLNYESLIRMPMEDSVKLVHDAPHPVDLALLTRTLSDLQDSEHLKQYQRTHRGSSFVLIKNGLERLLKDLSQQTITGFDPREAYRNAYRTLHIQLTNTLHKLSSDDSKQEELALFIFDLGYYGSFCGPQISAIFQEHYNAAFGLFDESQLVEASIEGILRKGYKRGALEVLEQLKACAIDSSARAQSIHVLHHLRKELKQSGYPLPADMRVSEIHDQFSAAYGSKDFPAQIIPAFFEGMLIVQFAQTLAEMQREAIEQRKDEQVSLLVEGVKECLLFLEAEVDLGIVGEIASQRDATLKALRLKKEELEKQKGSAREYQKLSDQLETVDTVIKNAVHELAKEKDDAKGLCLHSGPKNLHEIRIEQLQGESKRQKEHLAIHMRARETLLSSLATHPLAPIAQKVATLEKEIEAAAREFSDKIAMQLEKLAISHGFLRFNDETDMYEVTPKGMYALLRAHKYYIPSNALVTQRVARQEFDYFHEEPTATVIERAEINVDDILA